MHILTLPNDLRRKAFSSLVFDQLDAQPLQVAAFMCWLLTHEWPDEVPRPVDLDRFEEPNKEDDCFREMAWGPHEPRRRMADLLWRFLTGRTDEFQEDLTVDVYGLAQLIQRGVPKLLSIKAKLKQVVEAYAQRCLEDQKIGQGSFGEAYWLPHDVADIVRKQLIHTVPDIVEAPSQFEYLLYEQVGLAENMQRQLANIEEILKLPDSQIATTVGQEDTPRARRLTGTDARVALTRERDRVRRALLRYQKDADWAKQRLLQIAGTAGTLMAQRFVLVPKTFEASLYVDLVDMLQTGAYQGRCSYCGKPLAMNAMQQARWRRGLAVYHAACRGAADKVRKQNEWVQRKARLEGSNQ